MRSLKIENQNFGSVQELTVRLLGSDAMLINHLEYMTQYLRIRSAIHALSKCNISQA